MLIEFDKVGHNIDQQPLFLSSVRFMGNFFPVNMTIIKIYST